MWGKAGLEFITSNGQKISREAILRVIIVIDEVEEGNLGMVNTFCHQNQDVCLQCTHCPTSMWLTRAKCGCNEKVHQHPLYTLRVLPSPLSRCEHSLLWCFLCQFPTGMATLMLITPLLWHRGGPASGRGKNGGWKCFPASERLSGKGQKNSTTSVTQFCCWFLCQSPILVKKRVPRWRREKDQAFT